MQGDLKLLVAVAGLLHQGAFIGHVSGHIHDHAGIFVARPVPDAHQGHARGNRRLGRCFLPARSHGRRGGRGRRGLGLGRGLGRNGIRALAHGLKPLAGFRGHVSFGVRGNDRPEDLLGPGHVLGLLQIDHPLAIQRVIGPTMIGKRGQHAVKRVQRVLAIRTVKRTASQFLVGTAQEIHGPGRELTLGVSGQRPLKRLHHGQPLGPKTSLFLIFKH